MTLVTGDDAEVWEHAGEVVRASYSSLSTHRTCPQKFFYRYVMRLTEPDTAPTPERDFGSWWSVFRATDALERGRKLDSLKATPRVFHGVDEGPEFDQRTVTLGDVMDAATIWWRQRTPEVQEAWLSVLGESLPARLRTLNDAYYAEWGDQIATERPLGVEVKWERVLPRPVGDSAWQDTEGMPDIVLMGTLDEVYFDSARRIVVVRDGKSSKQLSAQSHVDDMMDSQLQVYGWGAAPLVAAWGMGPIRAVAFDRARSVAPKPPHLTLSGTLAVRGGEPTISATDLATYLAWAKGADGEGVPWGEEGVFYKTGAKAGEPKFGRYTADERIIARLSTPAERSRWFQRQPVPLNLAIVRSHLRAAVDTATDIWRTEKRSARTGEAGRNLVKTTCGWCDYSALCRAQMIGGADGQYELAEYGLVSRDNPTLSLALERTELIEVTPAPHWDETD
jgi:hypothetical protein